MRAIALGLIIVLAGCADPQSTSEEPVPEPQITETNDFDSIPLEAVEVNITADDWYLLPLDASPAGEQAGFQIEVPSGASVATWYDATQRRPLMEVALIGDGDVEALHVVTFNSAGETYFEFIQIEVESELPLLGGMGGVSVNEYSTRGSVGADYDELRGVTAGDTVAIVVGAVGTGDATIGVRFLPADPFEVGDFSFVSYNGKEFLSNVDGPGIQLQPLAAASGLRVGLYYERFSAGLGAWSKGSAGHMEVAAPAPAIGVSAVTATAPAHDAGYASAASLVWNQAHAGVVGMELETPEGAISEISPMVPDPIVSSTIGLIRGDGAGTGAAELTVAAVGTPTLFPQLYLLAYVGSDASLASLVGFAPEAQSLHFDGLPVMMEDDRRTKFTV